MATMRSTSAAAFLVPLALAAALRGDDAPAKADKSQVEPPQEFTLTIDGRAVEIRPDEPVKIKVGEREVEVKLTARPDRLFSAPGLSFRYPAGHGFDSERSAGSTRWTLGGRDNVLILSRLAQKADAGQMTRVMVEQLVGKFGRENVKTAPSELRLGGRAYPATRLDITLIAEHLTYDVCAFDSGGTTFLLMMQDMPKPDGTPSDETRHTRELLDKTLKLGGARP